ncbi:hypothetical protein Trydic_g5485 [Trypoxylus dichotomus]
MIEGRNGMAAILQDEIKKNDVEVSNLRSTGAVYISGMKTVTTEAKIRRNNGARFTNQVITIECYAGEAKNLGNVKSASYCAESLPDPNAGDPKPGLQRVTEEPI